jgi:8-oxo-dGTP diphosphatase
LESRLQRFGTTPDPNQRYKARPGVYAILPHAGGLLTTFQAGIHNEYQLPGGGIDPEEQPLQALYREVFEETGWRITQPRVFFRFRRFLFMPDYDLWAEKICTVYSARPVRRHSIPPEPDHYPVVLPIEEAMNRLANSGDRHAVTQFFGF